MARLRGVVKRGDGSSEERSGVVTGIVRREVVL